MKRKILAIMLSSMLAFSFTACGNTEETADGTVTNAEADVDVADTGTDVENDAAETDAADIVVDRCLSAYRRISKSRWQQLPKWQMWMCQKWQAWRCWKES